MRKFLATREIPSPKKLIKDHNKIDKKGRFSNRLVIPATNFTATFSKIGYLEIKSMLDKAKVKYSRVSIVQSSDLEEIIKELEVKRDKIKIASVDATNMYPSVKLSTIKKSVRFFTRKLTAATKKTINLCLELIRFRMSSTLISFDGEYYEYHSGEK